MSCGPARGLSARGLTARSLVGLVAGAALLVVLAVYGFRSRTAMLRTQDGTGPVFPALGNAAAMNAIDRLEVDDGIDTVVLARTADGGWVIASTGNYPADASAVKSALMGLASLEFDQRLTANPAKHGARSLEYPRVPDPTAASTDGSGTTTESASGGAPPRTGTRLRAFAGGDQPVAAAIVGQSTYKPRTQAIRLDGEDQVWRVKGSAEAKPDRSTWMERELIAIPSDSIQRIEFEGLEISRKAPPAAPEGAEAGAAPDTLSAPPASSADWDVVILGPVEWDASDANRAKGPLTSLLTRLEIDDIRVATDIASCEPTVLHYSLSDGALDFTMWDEDGRTWMSLSGDKAPTSAAEFQFRLPEWKANQIKNLRPRPRVPEEPLTPPAPVTLPAP
ncbi:MAG: DUF4340 domain-containing protein [Planctomycetota bacterium]|nr:DUF4340 domain-containing protein [Planctomycetota bacterium]MDA1106120.1 DUF4340 domain-containing protein [Planctomycetota bacterium]